MFDDYDASRPQADCKSDNIGKWLDDKVGTHAMVDWRDPSILIRTAFRHIASGLIGQYADIRPQQANFDPTKFSATATYETAENDPHWIDFVADVGDGFDATYAIAYLVSQPSLKLIDATAKRSLELPAGTALVVGGDLAYPDATAANYNNKFVCPYSWARPGNDKDPEFSETRDLYCVAGNHDWYDGLQSFSDRFVAASASANDIHEQRFGSWRIRQRRSYFAVMASPRWAILGLDLGMTHRLDRGQIEYFRGFAKQMYPKMGVLVVLHEPVWLQAQGRRAIHHVEAALKEAGLGCEVKAVIAGDLHHYSRYESKLKSTESTIEHFVTCGGGGAFLHSTHDLPTIVPANAADDTFMRRLQYHPAASASRCTALRHFAPNRINIWFSTLVAALYLLVALTHQSAVREQVTDKDLDNAKAAFESAQALQFKLKPKTDKMPDCSAENVPSDMAAYCQALSHTVELMNAYFRADRWHNHCFRAYRSWDDLTQYEPSCKIDRRVANGQSQDGQSDTCRIERESREAFERFVSKLSDATARPMDQALDKTSHCMSEWRRRYDDRHAYEYLSHFISRSWTYFRSETDWRRELDIGKAGSGHLSIVVVIWALLIAYTFQTGPSPYRWSRSRVFAFALCFLVATIHLLVHYFFVLLSDATAQEFADIFEQMMPDRSAWTKTVGLITYVPAMLVLCYVFAWLVLASYFTLASLVGAHPEAYSYLSSNRYKSFLRMKFDGDDCTIYAIGLDDIPPSNWKAVDSSPPASKVIPIKSLAPRIVDEFKMSLPSRPPPQPQQEPQRDG